MPGTADEVANVAELLMSDKGAFITGSIFLIDGGATASYFYGPLQPEAKRQHEYSFIVRQRLPRSQKPPASAWKKAASIPPTPHSPPAITTATSSTVSCTPSSNKSTTACCNK